VIDAPAFFVNHLFDLTSICIVAQELLLALSKLCPASRSSQLATTCVLGDLVFLSSKVYIFPCVIIGLVYSTLLIKLAWHCTSLNIIVDATLFSVQL
jgi:hypothetical protein